jgi:hypothetical protein
MTIDRTEVREIAEAVVERCKHDVNKQITEHLWTEEKAKKIAEDAARMAAQMAAEPAAELAVQKITNNFYMSIGKKTFVVTGALVVGYILMIRDELRTWFGMR